MKNICGIQQMGVGVENIEEAWAWYRKYLGMNICVFEEKAIAEFMLPYTEGKPRERHAVLAMNMQGGGGFEVWQHTGKKPQTKTNPLIIGDIGINICKLKTTDIYKAYDFYKKNNINIISEIYNSPNNVKHFFIKDPYDNIFQIVENDYIFVKDKHINGGVFGAIIGVSDIEKSLVVYKDILDYDNIIYDETNCFNDFSNLNGGNHKFRRILLSHTKKREGAFSKLLGPTQIELIQILDRTPEKVFEGRIWGDPGFIHICFDITGFEELKKECKDKGHEFTVDSTINIEKTFDMGDAAGDFAYISDPDNIPIEFVQTRKVPIIKKIGFYIKLYKRDPKKSLPTWLLKAFRFQKRK